MYLPPIFTPLLVHYTRYHTFPYTLMDPTPCTHPHLYPHTQVDVHQIHLYRMFKTKWEQDEPPALEDGSTYTSLFNTSF